MEVRGPSIEAEAIEALQRYARNPAVVTIDLHRGHLDPDVATLPLPADRAAALMARVVPLLDQLRAVHAPVFHVMTVYRDKSEIVSNPYWHFQAGRSGSSRSRIAEHNLEGLPGVALMPTLRRPGDVIVWSKKRYDAFIATELEFLLRSGGHDSLLIMGVNTNSCVIATGIAASVRDFAVFLVEDGIDSMLGEQLHDAARDVFAASFGWIVSGEAAVDVLGERAGRSGDEKP